jgi:sulfur relay (sulfurtransferase) DsrF/TusC family protein
MNKDIIGLFSSHFSLGKSTLTLDKPEEIQDNKPISIFSIAKKYELKDIYLVENNFSSSCLDFEITLLVKFVNSWD